ncbi:MAG TPA: tyrosine-type recombinase/integrase [Verrucomicrobiae bacterium]|nr:tyrosine-type recombinase/integrase [Verrucomicrobiae bacterium]
MAQKRVRIAARVRQADGTFKQVGLLYDKRGKIQDVPNATSYLVRVQHDGHRVNITRKSLDEILTAAANAANGPALVEDLIANAEAERTQDGTIVAAVEAWLDEVRAHRSKSTIVKYTKEIAAFTDFCNSHSIVRVDQVTRQSLLKFITYLRELKDENGETRLGGNTVAQYFLATTIFLKHAGRPGLLETDMWPEEIEPPVKFYSDEEVQKLRAAAREMNHEGRTQLLVEFLLFTGFRKGEAMHVTWADWSAEGQTIRVTPKPQYNWKPKTSECREVPIPESLNDLLIEAKKRATSELIFAGYDGGPLGRNTMTRWLGALGEKAGVAVDVDCHTFRRTIGTKWCEKSGIQAAKKYLGHSSIETTMRYLGVADVRSKETRKKIESVAAAFEAA